MRHLIARAACILPLAAVLYVAPAMAEDYPRKTITAVVPFAAGNFTDTIARIVIPHVEASIGQSIVIENRGGANGIIGAGGVARADPDGYTILLGTNGTQSAAPSLYSTLTYDPEHDFESVALMGTISSFLLVGKDSSLNTVGDVLEEARKQGGSLTYGAPNGTARFSATRLEMLAGIKLTEIPYGGTQQALTDLLGGRIDLLFNGVGSSTDLVRGKQVKALAVTYADRLKTYPDVPAVAESVPGYFSYGWIGVFAPKGTPEAIVARLNKEFNAALALPQVREKLDVASFDIKTGSPDELTSLVQEDARIWAEAAASGGWTKN